MSDKDSLFGSPPPSPPARGRSPSLALPEPPAWCIDAQASSQNVGTIALPGSHEHCSKHPVFIDPALPSGKLPVLSLRPPAQNAPPRVSSTPQPANHTLTRRPRSPSRLPSPAPINPQTDRTLRDLVSLVSHFEPIAGPTPSRPPPIAIGTASLSSNPPEYPLPGSAENPIEIDAPGPADAVNSALVALAGTVASALKLPATPRDVPSLSQPTVNNVLQFIKHDPKLIPVLQATYEYLGSIPNQPQPQHLQSFSHVNSNQPNPSSGKKKRRRKYEGPQVPAGAGHWNVPYPFAPGQAPSDYPSQWQLDRGRRVLGELLGLFERAFAKTRGDGGGGGTSLQKERPMKRRRVQGPDSVTESTRSDCEGSVLGANEKGSVAPGSVEGWQDHQRMNDWLSSVPSLSASSSIVDSTSGMPSPSPSDPAPSTSNSLQDFMAILGPDFFSGSSATPVDSGDKDPAFNFADAFDDVDFGQDDASAWSSMLEPGPNSQSINDITAFPMMGLLGGPEPLPQPLVHQPLPHDFVIDPALMALSQAQSNATHLISQNTQPGQASSREIDFHAPAGDALSSVGPFEHAGMSSGQNTQPHASVCDQEGDVDSRSLLTVLTTSASSSQVRSQCTASPAPSVMSTASSLSAKAQRKAVSLAKAQEHRARLITEIERVRMERWETVIEGGVLRNLHKADAP